MKAADIALPAAGVVAGLAALLGGRKVCSTGWGCTKPVPVQACCNCSGVAVTLFVLVALVSATAVVARPMWAGIAVRVVGSWIGASGLLWVGWVLHGLK